MKPKKSKFYVELLAFGRGLRPCDECGQPLKACGKPAGLLIDNKKQLLLCNDCVTKVKKEKGQ